MVYRSPVVAGLILDPALTAARTSSVEVHVEPSVGILARKIDKLGLDIRSFREPLTRAVKEVMIPSIRTNFLKAGRPRWEDLAESTWDRKTGHGILRETDSLMNTMGQLNIWVIDKEKALIADLPENVWYGKVHQAGSGDPGAAADVWFDPVLGHNVNVGDSAETSYVPARPFIMMQKEDEEDIERIFDEWLGERIARAGLGNDATSRRRHV